MPHFFWWRIVLTTCSSLSNSFSNSFLCCFQQLIMQKAAEELKKQQEREMEEKKKAIEARVPKLEIDGLDKRTLVIIFITMMHNISGVTTDPADPAMRVGPRAYGGPKLWHQFFSLKT